MLTGWALGERVLRTGAEIEIEIEIEMAQSNRPGRFGVAMGGGNYILGYSVAYIRVFVRWESRLASGQLCN